MPNYRASVGHNPFIIVKRANPITMAGQNVGLTIGGGAPLFFDDFNYTLNRIDSEANKNAIVQARGWAGLADSNASAGRAGHIYTVAPSDVPGHVGTFPGSTQRALLVERVPINVGGMWQSDVWLQLNNLPANIYYFYWMRVINSGAMLSQIGPDNKHLYPTNGSWPAIGDNEAYISIVGSSGQQFYAPGNQSWNQEAQNLQSVFFSLKSRKEGYSPPVTIDNTNSNQYPGGSSALWQNLSGVPVPGETWAQVVEHIDVSGSQGIYEVWTRLRNQAWVKKAEWIGGVTSGMTWATSANDRNGQAGMQWPSVAEGQQGTISGNHYYLFQDFGYAASFAAIPTYGDEP